MDLPKNKGKELPVFYRPFGRPRVKTPEELEQSYRQARAESVIEQVSKIQHEMGRRPWQPGKTFELFYGYNHTLKEAPYAETVRLFDRAGWVMTWDDILILIESKPKRTLLEEIKAFFSI